MKKYVLLNVLLFVCAGIYAQTREDTLKQSKNFLNDKLTYLLLQEFVKDSIQYQNVFTNISKNFQDVSVSSSFPYTTMYSILKGKFDKVLIKFSEPVDKINIKPFIALENSKAATALADSVYAVINKNYPEKYQSLQVNKQPFTDEIIAYLQHPASTGNNNTPGKPAAATPESSFNYGTPIILLLMVVITAIGYSKFKSVEQKLKDLQTNGSKPLANSIPDKTFYEAPYKQQSQKSDVDRLIDNNKTIVEFQKAIQNLQARLLTLEQMQTKPTISQSAPPVPAAPAPAPRKDLPDGEVFYMTLPINNYFLVKSKSLTKDNTIYKFLVKPNKQEADFSVHISGAQLNDVLSVIETYIKPACDEENLASPNVKNIITLKPGTAVLEGDKWIIKNKALIRYE